MSVRRNCCAKLPAKFERKFARKIAKGIYWFAKFHGDFHADFPSQMFDCRTFSVAKMGSCVFTDAMVGRAVVPGLGYWGSSASVWKTCFMWRLAMSCGGCVGA